MDEMVCSMDIVFGNSAAPIFWVEYDNGGCMLREKVHFLDIRVTVKPFETLAELSTTGNPSYIRHGESTYHLRYWGSSW